MSFLRSMRRKQQKRDKPAQTNQQPWSPEVTGSSLSEEASGDAVDGIHWYAQRWGDVWMSALGPRSKEVRRLLETHVLSFLQSIGFEPGQIMATAQHGSKRYKVALNIAAWPAATMAKVVALVAADPQARAEVAAGQVTSHLARLLSAADIQLPVANLGQVTPSCTCPANDSLCLHVLALAYVLIDAMADNPHFLLAVRGLHVDVLSLGVSQIHGSLDRAEISPAITSASDDAAAVLGAPAPLVATDPLAATAPLFSGPTSVAALGHLDGWKLALQPEALWRPSILQAAQTGIERAEEGQLQ